MHFLHSHSELPAYYSKITDFILITILYIIVLLPTKLACVTSKSAQLVNHRRAGLLVIFALHKSTQDHAFTEAQKQSCHNLGLKTELLACDLFDEDSFHLFEFASLKYGVLKQ